MSDQSGPGGKPVTRFASGTLWMVAMRWAMRLIGLVSTLVLARLLSPEDFGLVAMAMVVIALIDTLADAGVDLAVIRDRSDNTSTFNAAWTIQILQAILVAAMLLIVAPFAVEYFSEPRLLDVLRLLSLSTLIFGFRNIGIVAFRKDLDFAKDFQFSIYVKLLSFVVLLSLALWLRDYRAIVFGMVFKSLINVLMSYVMHDYRPRITTDGISRIWGFSQWLLVSRMGTALNNKSSEIVLGGMLGASQLGYYYLAIELGTVVVFELIMPIRRSFFPNLSKLLDDREQFAEYAFKAIGFISILVIPIGAGLYITADAVTIIMLGDKWIPIIGALQWIALYSSVAGISFALDLILLVLGKPKYASIKVWSETLVLIPVLIVVGRLESIELIALARFLVSVIFLPLMVYFVAKSLERSMFAVNAVIWRPVAAAVTMVLVDKMLLGGFEGNLLLELILHVALGITVYAISLAVLWVLSGRPDSAESLVAERFRVLL